MTTMAFAIVAGCSASGQKSADGIDGSNGGTATITIVPSSAKQTTAPKKTNQLTETDFAQYSQTTFPVTGTYVVPQSLSDFDCFAVNVLGENIHPTQACGGSTSMGVAGGFVNGNGGTITLDVPFGPARTFQIWGFAKSSYCPDVTTLLNLVEGAFPPGLNSAGFLLAEITTDVFATNMTLNMTPTYSYGANPMMCGRLPPPTTTIDFVTYDHSNPLIQNLPVSADSTNTSGVCVGFHTTASNPAFSCTLAVTNTQTQPNSLLPPTTSSQGPSGLPCQLPLAPGECLGVSDPGGYVLAVPFTGLGGLNLPTVPLPKWISNISLTIQSTDINYGLTDPTPPTFNWTVDQEQLDLSFNVAGPGGVPAAQPDFSAVPPTSLPAGGFGPTGYWFTDLNILEGNLYVNKPAIVCACTAGCAPTCTGGASSPACTGAGWSICSQVSGNGNFQCETSPPLPSSPGPSTVTFCAKDGVGNVAQQTANVWLDNTTPGGITMTPAPVQADNTLQSWPIGGFYTPAGATNFTIECNEVIPGAACGVFQGINSCNWTVDAALQGTDVSTTFGAIPTNTCTPTPDGVDLTVPNVTVQPGGYRTVAINASNWAGTNAQTISQQVFVDNLTNMPGLGRFDQNDAFVFDESTSFSSGQFPNMPGANGLWSPSFTALDVSSAPTNNGIGYLYASDTGNSRVLVYEYNTFTLALVSHKAAFVYGEPNFTTTKYASGPPVPTSSTGLPLAGQFSYLNAPTGLAVGTITSGPYVNQKKLWVADSNNNRVLQFDITNGPGTNLVAEVVFGQSDQLTQVMNCPNGANPSSGTVTSSPPWLWPNVTCGAVAPATATGLYYPTGLAFYENFLVVSDTLNCRVVTYNLAGIPSPPHHADSVPIAASQILGNAGACTGPGAPGVGPQPNFPLITSGPPLPTTNAAQNALSWPMGIAVDSVELSGLYVADSGNNRIMVWPLSAISAGAAGATEVIGQPLSPGQTSPASCTSSTPGCFGFDASDTGGSMIPNNVQGVAVLTTLNGSLVIAATEWASAGDNQVKFYQATVDSPPFNFTIGTSVWNSAEKAAVGLTGLNGPLGIFFSQSTGQIFVSESANNRIGLYPFQTVVANQPLIDAIGHTDDAGAAVSYVANAPNSPNSTNMYHPTYGVIDTNFNRIYVSDSDNNRVLIYSADPTTHLPVSQFNPADVSTAAPPTGSGGVVTGVAIHELGVPFNSNGVPMLDVLNNFVLPQGPTGFATFYPINQNTLTHPLGLALDAAGKLFVSDYGNNRVLRFPTNTTSLDDSMAADLVLGPANFLTVGSTTVMSGPVGLAYDSGGDNLYVADEGNNRVLVFPTVSTASDGEAALVLGPTLNLPAPVSGTTTFSAPMGLAFTQGSTPVDRGLFVADAGNNRIMYFDMSTSTNGLPQNVTNGEPWVCFGQQGATINANCSGVNANGGAGNPMGATGIDTQTTGGGQFPTGLWFRESSPPDLFVGDFYNHRVVVYDFGNACNSPANTLSTAGVCGGQTVFQANESGHVIGGGTITGAGLGTQVINTTTSSQAGVNTSGAAGCGWTPSTSGFPRCSATPTALSAPVGIFGAMQSGQPNLLYIIDQYWNRVGVYETP